MHTRRVDVRPAAGPWKLAFGILCVASFVTVSPIAAQTTLPPVKVGAGLQTSFLHTSPDESDGQTELLVNSARIYISGPVTENISFMFNTEYNGNTNAVGVLWDPLESTCRHASLSIL